MPYRIKKGQEVLLLRESGTGDRKTFNRTVDFEKVELLESPLDEHRREGIPESPFSDYPWGFKIAGKWENVGKFVTIYAREVHNIARGNPPKDLRTVVVPGSKSNQYTLELNEYGEALTCTCMGFRFNRQECKHIRQYNNSLAG